MRTKKRAPPYGGFQGLIIKAFKCGKLKKSQIYARIISMILSDFYFLLLFGRFTGYIFGRELCTNENIRRNDILWVIYCMTYLSYLLYC